MWILTAILMGAALNASHSGHPSNVPKFLNDAICVSGPGCSQATPLKRTIVLDFWATWCGPCVESLPHLDRLAKDFKDDIDVVAITDEPRDVVDRAIGNAYPSITIMSDTARRAFGQFDVERLPTTILLAPSGSPWLRTGMPLEVDQSTLKAFLKGQPPPSMSTPPPDDVEIRSLAKNAISFSALVPSTQLIETQQYTPSLLVGRGLTVRSILAIAYELPPTRVEFEVPEPEFRYDYYLSPPGTPQALRSALQGILATAFGADVKREDKPLPGYKLVLQSAEKLSAHLARGEGSSMARHPGSLEAAGMPLSGIANQLELVLEKPVVLPPDADLRSRYDFHLEWSAEDASSLAHALSEALGIAIQEQSVTVPVLAVIKLRAQPASQVRR